MKKVAVLGAGSWGTALAVVLADNNYDVRLWTYKEEQAADINNTHKNEQYLDVTLPENIVAYYDLKLAIQDVECIVIVVPTKAVREVCTQLTEVLHHQVKIIQALKVLE